MPNSKKPSGAEETESSEHQEINSEDFQFVLKHLLAAYQPVLEEDLKRAKAPEQLEKEADEKPPSCDDELALANRIFEKFFTEEVAVRLLPAVGRELLGPIDRWRWCFWHIRCCIIFGWLICHHPRTFRASVYYLYRYWICVRQILNTPVHTPHTAEERQDLQTLVQTLARAYKPFLTDQLATVEFPDGLSDEVLAGRIDCFEGDDQAAAVFERFLTMDTAQALLGREAFASHRSEPFVWFCRCWCLCAIRFGCCLAHAHSLKDLVWCIRHYFRCLRRCVAVLHCKLIEPSGCALGQINIVSGMILEPVIGDAYGLNFGHYVIEVRDPTSDLLSGVVVYPNGIGNPDLTLTQGNFAIAGGTLGWIDLKKCAVDAGVDLLTSTTFEITLRVFATGGSELSPPCKTTFSLSVNEVYIKRVSTPWSVTFTDPNEPLRVANNVAAALATVGGAMHVRGAANVYGCTGEKIQEYTIWAIPDATFTVPQPPALSTVVPAPSWVQVAHVEFNSQGPIPQPIGPPITYTADQVRSYNILNGDPLPDILTNVWGIRQECICFDAFICLCWNVPSLDPNALNSNVLPKLNPIHEGGTGKFSFLLQVIDTSGNTYYDIQRVWVDNEPLHYAITGIAGLAPCADLYTKTSTGMFKTVNVMGTAWDQLIELGNLAQPTSDNFDLYTVHFQKQSAAGLAPLISSVSPVPPRPQGLGVGVLTTWNLQSVDAATNPNGLPADQLLAPGQECVYNVILQVWDKTIVNEGTVHYSGYVPFPIKIINGPEP